MTPTITLPRATVEQALERLRQYHHGNGFAEDAECIANLERALAQQAEPVEPITRLFGTLPVHDAQQAEPVEPVAYIHRQGNHWEVSERHLDEDEKARGWTEEPLYTAPPQQAEPVEPVACPACEELGYVPLSEDGRSVFIDGVGEVPLAQQAEPVEPVAWGVDWGRDGDRSCVSITKKRADGTVEVVAVEYGPLYAAPPKLVPLTEEEIDALPWNGSPRQFARAVERALEEKNRGR